MKNYDIKLHREFVSLNNMELESKLDVKNWIRSYIEDNRPDARILDMGSFNGGLQSFLKAYGIKADGIELHPVSARIASEYGRIFRYDLEKRLPIRDNSYDIITCIDIHEHLYNAEELVGECHRILKDGGVLIIYTSNHQHWSKRLQFLFGYIGYKAFGFGEHHVRFVSHSIFRKWLEPYFEIRHIPCWVPFPNLFKRHCWYLCRRKACV